MPALKVWPVADGAWQVRLPLPWELASVNVFLFRRGNGFVLLDSGIRSDDSLLALEAALLHLGADWTSITEILISHLHPDHMGAAAEIRRRSGAPVRMPALEAELVRPLGPHQRFFGEAAVFLRRNGMPVEDVETMRRSASAGRRSYERLLVDGPLEEGERIGFEGGTLNAVAAPGHSPALLCFYCPQQKVLFSTDAILPRITPNIGVQWFYEGDPLGDYLGSLEKLEKLDAGTVVPSHGRPFQGHREWIESTRSHHARRCDTIAGTLADDPLDAYRIAGAVWGEHRSLQDRRFAMSESLSHLEYMALGQRVEKIQIDGVAHWKRQ
ncbi:MAG: MBL fold metallo-hydrolase [Bryobacterales bacterium]|nr:MBL fold metallo-hydrolase [Bryobacterales bacterium]